ncbi:MAG: trypsin-like peptidase domain-containing protein [Pseudomonadales bacterium]|nr:trypsin-like peptidase domain-containing protein [Pseudomonadales bacterium]
MTIIGKLKNLLVPALIGALIGLSALLIKDYSSTPTPNLSFADAVSSAAPAVVNIYSSIVVPRRLHPLCELPSYRDLCQNVPRSSQRMQNSLGSGVVVSKNGYILTNNHVIKGASEIQVDFPNSTTSYTATVIGADIETDLAVIKVHSDALTAIKIGSSEQARVGDPVLAIGNPFGIGQTVSMGIISAKGRTGVTNSLYTDFLQTDAAINPGNSGGALIDAQGRLLGINSLIYSRTGIQGISFAIPVEIALEIVRQIVNEGEVIRGWLGIEAQTAQENNTGLIVTKVILNGPAQIAGLIRGDRIITINNQPVVNPRVVTQQIALTEPGTPVSLVIMRNGEKLELQATSGTRPENLLKQP